MQLFNSTTRVTSKARSCEREPTGINGLLTRVRSEVSRRGRGSVIAFTSANAGEGVSHVVQFFAEKLAMQTGQRTVLLDASRLRDLHVADFVNTTGCFVQTSVPNLWLLAKEFEVEGASEQTEQGRGWQEDAEWGLDPLQALTATFTYTLIDCPSLAASYDAEMLAPDVDGVVLVVAADRTKRDQILRARRTIEMANGKLTGLVLNRRRHVVPEWIYRKL